MGDRRAKTNELADKLISEHQDEDLRNPETCHVELLQISRSCWNAVDPRRRQTVAAQPGPGWGPGMMMGPGMMGGGGFGFFCNPRMAGFAEWRLQEIETAVHPNDKQKSALDELKAASAKAADIIIKDCSSAIPAKPTERLELAEKRLETMLQAIKSVRPAFQAFYESLDDTQRAALNSAGPRPWGWRHWRWPWDAE